MHTSLMFGLGWALTSGLAISSETFLESLTIQPLLDEKVAFLFVFSTDLVKEPPRLRSDNDRQSLFRCKDASIDEYS
jgi:hypothetical protein